MIKTLSPYYLNIPYVSPLSGLTCTSFTLNLYVWNGNKLDIPTTETYSITKENATSDTGNAKINIARLISDFIDFTPNIGTVTEVVNGNNQQWVKWETFYATTNPSDATTPTNVNVKPFVKGFSYGLDGENASTPANKILIPIQEYKVNRGGKFILPIEVDEAESTIEAVNDNVNIFFQDTLIDVLVNDNLGFAPTTIISISSSMPTSVGTFSIESNKIKFNKGVGTIITPQTCSYTIQDITGVTSTATLTISISAVPTLPDAQDEMFAVNDTDAINLDVLNNDALGTPPTTIVSFDDSLLTCGAITNNGTDLTFTPNGVFDVSETFTYTIEDFLANQSTATVTLNVSHLIGETATAKRSLGFAENLGICAKSSSISFIVETQFAGEITDGDIAYNNDLTIFNGLGYYYRVFLDSDNSTIYNMNIGSDGLILIENLC